MLSLVALALVLGSCPLGVFATEAGDIMAGERSVCWEAHTPDWLCQGYESVGYTCVGEYCASMDPGGDPTSCAMVAGCSMDKTTARCIACNVTAPPETTQPELFDCSDTCRYAHDGECDDGSDGGRQLW